MDSLFAEDSDVFVEESVIDNIENIFTDNSQVVISDVTNWHFIVVRLKEDVKENFAIRKFNTWAKQNGYPIEAVNWRVAAGPTAQYVYWLRIVFLIGVFIILFAGLIVVTNTLVINVLDRTKEIGTMRALGANKRNIVFLCMSETLILSIISAIISFIISFFIVLLMQKYPITLNNIFFEQLFGGKKLIPELTLSNIGFGFLVSLIIGLTSWILPVIEALKILPIKAMKGGN
jgi:ABC-type antimicrobial peptide transport system permease subunit